LPKSILNLRQLALGVFLLVLATQTCRAEIYKWVDENGHTHYSERAGDAGNAKATEVKISPLPARTSPTVGQRDWQLQQRLYDQRQYQAKLAARRASVLAVSKEGAHSATAVGHDSDAGKCDLARNILNGRMRHPNGMPTDEYDREVASNDVKSFCHEK
jgi:hypothetical protein